MRTHRSRGRISPSPSGRTPRRRTPATTCGSCSTSCGRPCPTPTATSGPTRTACNGSRTLPSASTSPSSSARSPRPRRPAGRETRRGAAPAWSGRVDAVPGSPAPELLRRLDRTGAGTSRAAVRGGRGRARGPARGAARVHERHRPRPALAAARPSRRGGVPLAHAAPGAARRSGGRAPGVSPVRRRAPPGAGGGAERGDRPHLRADPRRRARPTGALRRARGDPRGFVPRGPAGRVGEAAGGLGAGRPRDGPASRS